MPKIVKEELFEAFYNLIRCKLTKKLMGHCLEMLKKTISTQQKIKGGNLQSRPVLQKVSCLKFIRYVSSLVLNMKKVTIVVSSF